jgi:hypothetical protein
VDDFSDFAVEACLVSKLPSLFSPDRVDELSHERIEQIASEKDEISIERTSLCEKRAVLSDALVELRRLGRYHQPEHRESTSRGVLNSEIFV